MEASENTSLGPPIDLTTVAMATGFISDKTLEIGLYISQGLLTAILVIFGTIANIINAVVYFKIGFKESMNISLWVLAISDLGSCFSLIMFAICYNPLVARMDLPFNRDQFNYFPGMIHNIFTRITSITTCIITIERCLCVVAPLKVKQIVTPKRVSIILACTIVFVVGIYAPHFFTTRYEFQFIPERNKSIIVVKPIKTRRNIDGKLAPIHSVFIPFSTLLVIGIATIVLVVSLRQKTKWRKSATSSANYNTISARDARISQMVLFIAIFFIAASLPVTVSASISLQVPEYYLGRRYHNLFKLVYSIFFNLEAFNSSINIFIYYRMSSAYKETFQRLFGRRENK